MNRNACRFFHVLFLSGVWILMMAALGESAMVIELSNEAGSAGAVVIEGVAAGPFNPEHWVRQELHWLFDTQRPLLPPQPGKWRNIYAPSIVPLEKGVSRVFYGGWDGIDRTNDLIYTCLTSDWRTFADRQMIINNGVYIHVNNVSALRLEDGGFVMMCTAYPDKDDLNKPAFFTSPDGITVNGAHPYDATFNDLITIEGYEKFAAADINGVNTLLREEGMYRLYFNNWKDVGHVYRASSRDGKRFQFEGEALATQFAVNDVKKFSGEGRPWYLMALHSNVGEIHYSLSRDGLYFEGEHVLTAHGDEADRYMVAVGLIQDGRRVLGILYGAGAVPSLDQNRIFAKWLQKRIVFQPEGKPPIECESAEGPNRAVMPLSGTDALQGHFECYGEDGKTLLFRSERVSLAEKQVWRIVEAGG